MGIFDHEMGPVTATFTLTEDSHTEPENVPSPPLIAREWEEVFRDLDAEDSPENRSRDKPTPSG